jgi:hypothetical protein
MLVWLQMRAIAPGKRAHDLAGWQGAKFTLGGFRLFVSSDGQVFGVAPRDIPSRRSLGVIQRGLRCLAGLPRESLEGMLVPLVAGEAGDVAGRGGRAGAPSAEAASLMVMPRPILYLVDADHTPLRNALTLL